MAVSILNTYVLYTNITVILPPLLRSVEQRFITTWPPFYYHGLTSIPVWISNYIHYNVWDEIIYPFLNFNGETVEV